MLIFPVEASAIANSTSETSDYFMIYFLPSWSKWNSGKLWI
jgi:hypothetical protein